MDLVRPPEFIIDWNTAVVGEQISCIREFGTHNIRQLITDGGYEYLNLDCPQFGRWYSESCSFFEGQPGYFNGVDLEGNFVQDISLVLEKGSKFEYRGTSSEFIIAPKFVFSGDLGDCLFRL
jgi:hypothetical protein